MNGTNFTMLVNTDYIKDIEELEEYLVLTQKPCLYSNSSYSIIYFTVLDETPECNDPETILEVMGGLVLHEEGSHCFLMLETDLKEVEDIFSWEGAAGILMGEMLTAEDKKTLLKQKQKKGGYTGDILINLGTRAEPQWQQLSCRSNVMFTDEKNLYQLGDNAPCAEVWWPYLLEESGGFNFVIKKEEDEEEEVLPPAKVVPDPFDSDYDDFFDDYDSPDWMHMHRGRYHF